MTDASGPFAALLTQRCGLTPPITCRLLRSHTNDVYRVESRDGGYILKVYGTGWRTADEIEYETALLCHLACRGVRVARPIGSVHELSGARYAVLFEYAEGQKPMPPFGTDLYYAFGKAIGAMHHASDDFVTDCARRSLDIQTLIDEPLQIILPSLPTEDRSFLLATAKRVTDALTTLSAETETLDWGPIHGDASLDNLHVARDGVILYDFDSGGPGWRASDLQGWAYGNPDYAEKLRAFEDGYATVRPLRDTDRHAAPYLTIAWDIWGIAVDLQRRILPQGLEPTGTYLNQALAALAKRCAASALT